MTQVDSVMFTFIDHNHKAISAGSLGENTCLGVDYNNQELRSEIYLFFAFVVSFGLCSLLEEGMYFLERKVECTSRLKQK